jgi:hypothetical protein
VYDSEDNKREAKQNKKRKAMANSTKKVNKAKTTWSVRPEDAANIGGVDSMLGKSMSR